MRWMVQRGERGSVARQVGRWVVLWALAWGAPAHSAIGDPCSANGDCGLGEICLVENGYCTARCPPEGCPSGYECDVSSGQPVCVRERVRPPPGELGDACGDGVIICRVGLVCAGDERIQVCSKACSGPGSCPAGFWCAGNNTRVCLPLTDAPGFGEPCGAGDACREPLVCHRDASRELPFCSMECDAEVANQCPVNYACTGGFCVPPAPVPPEFGGTCIEDAVEPRLRGCPDPFRCIEDGLHSYCTGPCSVTERCPEGYGCREQPDGTGECRRGANDDNIFEPLPDFGGGTFVPLQDASRRAPPGPAPSTGGGDGDGCAAAPGTHSGGLGGGLPVALGALLGLFGLAAFTRSPTIARIRRAAVALRRRRLRGRARSR